MIGSDARTTREILAHVYKKEYSQLNKSRKTINHFAIKLYEKLCAGVLF